MVTNKPKTPFTVSHCPARDLCSAERNLLYVPRHRLNIRPPGCYHVGPSAWSSLPDPVRNPNSTEASFRLLLKIFVFTVLAHPAH